MRLKADESFKGYALFEPDPEAENNPGYFEYYDHYDKQGNTYVPCSGEDCPFCAANDNPSTRALTVWYFPDAGDKKDELKIFTMNFSTINEITDESDEEGGVHGKKVRIRRMDDRGSYRVRILPDKPLTKKQQTDLLKRLDEEILNGNGLEGMVLSQLKRQLERLKAIDALEADDDDTEEDEEEETTPKARRGKSAPVEEEDEDEEEADEETDEEDEEDEEEADEDDESDEEESEEEDEDEEEPEAESDEPEEIKAGVYEVLKIQKRDEIFDLTDTSSGEIVKMWLGDGVEVDYDTVVKGATVVVDAATDEEGDWIITSIKLKPKRGRPAKKS